MKSKYCINLLWIAEPLVMTAVDQYSCNSTPIYSESILKRYQYIPITLKSLTKQEYNILIKAKKRQLYLINLVSNKIIWYT